MLAKFKNVFKASSTALVDRVLPVKPAEIMLAQAESIKSLLPYESFIHDEGRDLMVLADGALGVMWKLEPVAHELQSEAQLKDVLTGITKVFEAIGGERITFQLIYDSEPSPDFNLPDWYDAPDTFARKIVAERVSAIKKLASNPGNRPRLMKREIYLTMRLEMLGFGKGQADKTGVDAYFLRQADIMSEAVVKLRDQARVAEEILLSCAKLKTEPVDADRFVKNLRRTFSPNTSHTGFDSDRRIADQIISSSGQWNNDAIEIGSDVWEVCSWSDQPNVSFAGMLAELLRLKETARCVVNIRPANNTKGLEALANAVKNGGDAGKERQREEVYLTEKKLAYGETLISVSMHLLIKNTNRALHDPPNLRIADNICKNLSASTNIPFFVEKFAAQAVFMACLPLCYSKSVAGFIGRESRVLSSATGDYLPIYCGTKGEQRPCQLMQSRAGEAVWLNPRCSPTNPHLAILGSSGGGKSFYLSNLIISELAANPDAIVFHIDCITSCEYLAKAVGEEIGCQVIKPPEAFPNLFRGEITKSRLPTIIGVIEVAVNLASSSSLSAAEKVVLSDAIIKTYKDNRLFSEQNYRPGQSSSLGEYVQGSNKTRIPRLSEIVNSFTSICQKKSIDEGVGLSLREKLLPLFGSGPYAIVFDREDYADANTERHGYYLYDLVGVQGDKVLSTITSLIVISDVLRILDEPSNRGRKGLLIIDECGVNLSGKSEFLESFVNEKWPTLRKKGVVCIGVTNKADHYSDLPAPSTIWSISANKLILPMTKDDINIAQKKKLIDEPIYLDLIKSLQKRKGEFSECLWIGESMSGTFSYVPTGFDYWTAVNQDQDVANLEYAKELFGSYREAVSFMATRYPSGVTDDYGDPRFLTIEDKFQIESEVRK